MKQDTPPKVQYVSPVRKTLGIADKYNVVIFVIIVVIGLIFGILILSTIVRNLYVDSSTTNTTTTSFDIVTISKLNKLNTSDSNNATPSATGRQNPFFE
ncbi:hypothetical protein HGB25_01755 [Candidatus Saccharibacteria bacterium]|nr:hypothetical protein [Candidatus Saccharibacteria bacterium]